MKPHEILYQLNDLFERQSRGIDPLGWDGFYASVSIVAKSQIGFQEYVEKMKEQAQATTRPDESPRFKDVLISARLRNILRANMDLNYRDNPTLNELLQSGLTMTRFKKWRNAGYRSQIELGKLFEQNSLTLPA